MTNGSSSEETNVSPRSNIESHCVGPTLSNLVSHSRSWTVEWHQLTLGPTCVMVALGPKTGHPHPKSRPKSNVHGLNSGTPFTSGGSPGLVASPTRLLEPNELRPKEVSLLAMPPENLIFSSAADIHLIFSSAAPFVLVRQRELLGLFLSFAKTNCKGFMCRF